MDASKIKELIAELRAEIEPKAAAIKALERLVSDKIIVTEGPQDQLTLTDVVRDLMYGPTDSYVSLAIKIIEDNSGRPMAVKDIVERIREIKGNPGIERRSVESTLYQHAKSDKARLKKVGRGMYGLQRLSIEGPAA